MKQTKEQPTKKETNRKETIGKIIKIFFLPFFILVIHAVLSYFDAYHIYPPVDIPMHFFGGVSIGIMYTLIIKELQKSQYIWRINFWIYFVMVVSFVGTTAVGWEFFEFIKDVLFNTQSQPSLADTMKDMILGLCGGILGFLSNISKRL